MAVGAKSDLEELTLLMVDTLLLRDIAWLSKVGDKVQLFGLENTKVFRGVSLAVSASLIYEIIADAGLDKTTRVTAVPEPRERVVDETPLSAEMHRYDRGQVGRLLYLVSLRGDLQYTVGHHSRHISAPTVSDEGSLTKCIRYLHSTRRDTLVVRPKGRLISKQSY